jgi:hypothetical protein
MFLSVIVLKSKKQSIVLCGLFLTTILFCRSIDLVRANPIVPPKQLDQLFVGLFNNGTDTQHVRSNVTIDVYDFESIGHGDYLLRNHNDTDVEQPLCFVTGPYWGARDEMLLNVSVNGTTIVGTGYSVHDFYSEEEIEEKFTDELLQEYFMDYGMWDEKTIMVYVVNIPASSDILFSIEWSFVSGIEDNYIEGMFSPIQERIRQFYTGYTINGGKHWNNRSIESEKISFRFHTEKFFVDDGEILVNISAKPWRQFGTNYQDNWDNFVSSGTPVLLEDTPNGLTYTLEYSDILDDIHISIINDVSTTTLSPIYILAIVMVACGISVFVVIKNRDKIFKK